MDIETPRRRFLQLAGTGATLSVAGCNALQSNQSDQSEGDGDGGGGTATVAVAVEPDRQALQERQAEIQSDLQSGNISRQEAQQQFQEAEQELLANATDAFESRVSEESALTAEDSIDEFGLFLVEGEPAALIETLSYEEVAALIPESSYEEASQQAGGGQPGGGEQNETSG